MKTHKTPSLRNAIRRPLRYIAVWQSLTFLLLTCVIWAFEMYGLLYGGQTDVKRAFLLTGVLVLGGVIIVAHSYIQERNALRGLFTICAYCHKVRIDQNAWTQIEQFVVEHSDADFTHGVCPSCFHKVTAEMTGKPNPPV